MGCNTSNEVKAQDAADAPVEASENTKTPEPAAAESDEAPDNETHEEQAQSESTPPPQPPENSEQPPAAADGDDNAHNNPDNDAAGKDDDGIEEFEEKSTSAKTVTLKSTRPNSESSVVSIRAELGSDAGQETTVTIEQLAQEVDILDVDEALAEELAATKIQAVFRGHQTRLKSNLSSMKQADKPASAAAAEPEPTREELEAEFRADDRELCHAATKIQASFRGHMARKTKENDKPEDGKDDNNSEVADEIADIDLNDPELSKAAVKIQASFRGHMARKDGGDN